jgi:putative transposase
MRKSRFTEQQIALALRQVDAGVPAADLCRKLRISEQSFYAWKKKYAVKGLLTAA